MITNQELRNLVTEWQLRDDVIEKIMLSDGFYGVLVPIDLGVHWAFKGGTSLKKCYVETWRFSEDLDFTIIPGGPDKPETIEPVIKRILERVHDESGIDFSMKLPAFKHADKYLYTEGSIYYRGPRNAPSPAKVKLDISGSEKIVRPTVLREISHSYSDTLPRPAQVRCYAFEEVFAEKLRAMGERGRPRDLYDIVLLFRRRDLQSAPQIIKEVLISKCSSKGVPVPTLDSIQNATTKTSLLVNGKICWGINYKRCLLLKISGMSCLTYLAGLMKPLNRLFLLIFRLKRNRKPFGPRRLPSGNGDLAFRLNQSGLRQSTIYVLNWGIEKKTGNFLILSLNHTHYARRRTGIRSFME